MQRRASVLAAIVMAPSLVDYTGGKAKKDWAGAGMKPGNAQGQIQAQMQAQAPTASPAPQAG